MKIKVTQELILVVYLFQVPTASQKCFWYKQIAYGFEDTWRLANISEAIWEARP